MHILLVVLAVSTMHCGTTPEPSDSSPATVENAVPESALSTVTLSPQAEQRLGIETTEVRFETVKRIRTMGGIILEAPGRLTLIDAPFPGKIIALADGNTPSVGTRVVKDQPILRLVVLPSERDLLGAREEVRVRQSAVALARTKADRARQLLEDKAGSVRELEEAEAALAVAEAYYNVAQARLNLIEHPSSGSTTDSLSPLVIASPQNGVIKAVHATTGQIVAAGTPLCEVSGIHPIWVRIPVYAGEVEAVSNNESVLVRSLVSSGSQNERLARSVTGPITANPEAASVDLYFSMENNDGLFLPGQRVSVELATDVEEENLVVPFSSILYDYQGGTWVYENTAPHVFVRRRVEIKTIVEDRVVVTRGLTPGSNVVSIGAVELFGTEFGVGK